MVTASRVPALLKTKTTELLQFLQSLNTQDSKAYEKVEAHLAEFKAVTQTLDEAMNGTMEELRNLQRWFRKETDSIFQQSRMMKRTRTWPEGYPGDYLTVEGVYANHPEPESGIGNLLDRYFLSRTLAQAVRARLKKLSHLLHQRTQEEKGSPNWLSIACGPCRELLSVPAREGRTIWCFDYDPKALNYAENLLKPSERRGEKINFVRGNAFQLCDPAENIKEFAPLTTLYSAGLFDYLATDRLVLLVRACYHSLEPGGVLIATFKDKDRYETFDYHWLVNWSSFLQRSEQELRDLWKEAGIPREKLTVERDDSGVILFFLARRAGGETNQNG